MVINFKIPQSKYFYYSMENKIPGILELIMLNGEKHATSVALKRCVREVLWGVNPPFPPLGVSLKIYNFNELYELENIQYCGY